MSFGQQYKGNLKPGGKIRNARARRKHINITEIAKYFKVSRVTMSKWSGEYKANTPLDLYNIFEVVDFMFWVVKNKKIKTEEI